MKNKKALILALSAGLIASGGLVPVYAAEVPETPPTAPTENVGDENETPTENPTPESTGEGNTTGSEAEESASEEDPEEGESNDDPTTQTPPTSEEETKVDVLSEEFIKEARETPKDEREEHKKSSDTAEELEWDNKWNLPENENLEKSPDDYEVVGKREGKGIDFDALYDEYKDNDEFKNKIVTEAKTNLENNRHRIPDRYKGFYDRIIESYNTENPTDSDVKQAIATLKTVQEEFDKRELIDYIKTEYSVDNNVEIEYDETLENGIVKEERKAEKGYKKSVITEGSPSSIFKIGDFLTSEQIREKIESNNDLEFKQIGPETPLESLTEAQIQAIFPNGIKPLYKHFDAKNENGDKDTTYSTEEDILEKDDFSKDAVSKKIKIGIKPDNPFEDLYKDDDENSWSLIEEDNQKSPKIFDEAKQIFVETSETPNDYAENGLKPTIDKEFEKLVKEEEAKNNLEDAKAIAIAELGRIPDLTNEQRLKAFSDIAKANNIDKVNEVLIDANILLAENKIAQEEAAKEKAEQEAKEKAENDLEDAKAIAIADLGNKLNLTPEQRANAINSVAKADSVDKINEALHDAELLAEENKEAKKKAEEEEAKQKAEDEAREKAENDLEDAKAIAIADLGNKPNLTPEQRANAINSVAKADSVDKINEALHDAELLAEENQRAKEKEAEEAAKKALEEAKNDAISKIANTENLTGEQIAAAVSDIIKSESNDEISEILDRARKLSEENKKSSEEHTTNPPTPGKEDDSQGSDNNKPTPPAETPITKDYKRDLQEAINKLPNLSQAEKNKAIIDIQGTKTLEKALPLYNDAVALNEARKNDLAKIMEDYLDRLARLNRLLDKEKEDFAKRIRDKADEKDMKDIYLEAVVRDNLRVVNPLPDYSPSTPSSSTIATDVVVKNKDIVYVAKGYKYVAPGFHSVTKLLETRQGLIKALEQNRIMVAAARFLIENTPQTVAKVITKLNNQINAAIKLQEECTAAIAELDQILSYHYNTNKYLAIR